MTMPVLLQEVHGECGYGESVIYSNHTKLLLLENETHFIVILYR